MIGKAVARRAIKHYVETCDFCKTAFHVTSEDPSMLKQVYTYSYGGYGDQEKMVWSKDACERCYQWALEDGYGDSFKTAAYSGNLKR